MSMPMINSGPDQKNADIQQVQREKESRSNNDSLQSGVPAHVIFKLLGFTLAMVVGPIGCYFATLNKIFGGNSTYAGATAAIVANLILAGYIIVAYREDIGEVSETREEKKKK